MCEREPTSRRECRARLAVAGDLEALLALFRRGEVSAHAGPIETAQAIWASTLSQAGLFVFVSEADPVSGSGREIAATCMLITAPNLLREGRKHGFIENVLTDPDHRRRGHGRAVIQAALETAWAEGCHHVLLQSGRADAGVHRFYEACSFEAGHRTGYVARRPDHIST